MIWNDRLKGPKGMYHHQLEWYHESQQIPVLFAQPELQYMLKDEKLCNLLPLDLGQDVQ